MKNVPLVLLCTLLVFFGHKTSAAAQESEVKVLAAKVERARLAAEAAEQQAKANDADAQILEERLVPLKATATSLEAKAKTAATDEKKAEEKVVSTAANFVREQKAEEELRKQAEQATAGTPEALKKQAEAGAAKQKLDSAKAENETAQKDATEKKLAAAKARIEADKAKELAAAGEKAATEARGIAETAAIQAAAAKAEFVKAQSEQKSWVSLNDSVYAKSLSALTMLFVVAVLLESALSVIFNWRVFLTYFSLTGVKTIVMVVVSLVVVYVFDIDILANLIAAYKTSPGVAVPISSGPMSKFITALILAGGSAGVHNIMTALGYRDSRRQEEVVRRPPKEEAWISVRVTRQNAVGAIDVKIVNLGPTAAAGAPPEPIAGTITSRRPALKDILLRNVDRFPQNGGYSLTPNVVYKITVEGKDASGTVKTALGDKYVFAAGALVDFEVTI